MENVGLKVVLESEVAKAIKNTESFNKTMAALGEQAKKITKDFGLTDEAISKTGNAAKNASGKFVQFNKSMLGTSNHMGGFIALARLGEISYKGIEGSAGFATKAINKFNQEGQKLSRMSVNASGALTGFNRIVQDAPYGFIAIGNNISETLDRMTELIKKSGSVGAALKSLGASFLGSGGAIFAVNLAITGITTLVQKYGSLEAAVKALANPLSEQAKLQKAISDTILQGSKDAQAELVRVGTLYRATQNLNIPLAERNKIVDELQKKYPSYFNNLSNEEILAGKGASAYNRLKDSILATAQARAIEKKIAENGEKLLDLDFKRDDLNKKITATAEKLNKAQSTAASDAAKTAANVSSYGIASVQAGTNVQQLRSQLKGLVDDLRNNGTEVVKLNALNDILIGKTDELAQRTGSNLFEIKPDKGAKGKTVVSVMDDMRKQLAAIDSAFKTVNFNFDDIQGQKIQALTSAFEDLIKLGLNPADSRLKQIIQQIQTLSASVIGGGNKREGLLNTQQLFSFDKRDVKDISTGLSSERAVLRLPVTVALSPQSIDAQMQRLAGGITTSFDKYVIPAVEISVQKLNEIFNTSLSDAFFGISEGIGKALSGGGFGSILSGFTDALANFGENLGKQLIAQGLALEAFKKSLSTMQGIPAIIAGGALIAASVAFRSLAKNGLQSFATGGIANGPMVAKIGDNPGRREAIVPSEDWREAFGGVGGGDGFIAETRVRAQDLLILIKKAEGLQGRTN
ncbi:hypothetical protein [Chitinophaga sp.]|uniref:hypothetical protein n=1 Tax=Chitinophaga sp. TaxID=1869181 RepID=UPI0031DEE025